LRRFADDRALLGAWRDPRAFGIDLREEALAMERDARGLSIAPGGRAARAILVARTPNRLEVRAEGPGLLVVAESWDRGWHADTDGIPAHVLRVDQALLATPLGVGLHRVVLRYEPAGFRAGMGLFAIAAAALVALVVVGR
jgi:Bacterial membrane protein YfhO